MRIRKLMRKSAELVIKLIFIAVGVIICMPVFLVVTGSVMGDSDLRECLAPVFLEGRGFVTWRVIPQYPTVEHYIRLLFQSPQFFYIVLEFCKIGRADSGGAAIGRCSGSMGIAVYQVRGKNLLFTTYVVLMLLPFQVTMLSSYLILNKLQLLNTHWAVILPAVFNTFPVFVTYGGFRAIPKAFN